MQNLQSLSSNELLEINGGNEKKEGFFYKLGHEVGDFVRGFLEAF